MMNSPNCAKAEKKEYQFPGTRDRAFDTARHHRKRTIRPFPLAPCWQRAWLRPRIQGSGESGWKRKRSVLPVLGQEAEEQLNVQFEGGAEHFPMETTHGERPADAGTEKCWGVVFVGSERIHPFFIE